VALKIEYVQGTSIDRCYFVASDGSKDKKTGELRRKVIRASRLLRPELHAQANEDTDDANPKVDVQPEQIIEEISKTAQTLEDFETVAFAMAASLNESIGAKAAVEDEPAMATEPVKPVKVGDKPEVAAEAQYAEGKVPTEGGSKVSQYYGRLPKKAPGSPEIALDLQSRVAALEGMVKKTAEERDSEKNRADEAEKKLDEGKKEKESGDALSLLADLGVVEDDKDRESYGKRIAKLGSEGIAELTRILKDVVAACEKKPAGAPKGAPKAPGAGPGEKPPVMSSVDNLVHASVNDDGRLPVNDAARIAEISNLWILEDKKKEAALLPVNARG